MLADIMLRKENKEKAVFHFQQLLERTPGITGPSFSFFKIKCDLALSKWKP